MAPSRPYPWYYAVNDRPVMIVELPDGGADCLVLDFASGEMAPNRAYFALVAPGSGKDVDALSEEEFLRLVAWHREEIIRRRCASAGVPGFLTVDRFAEWCARLCRLESGGPHAVAAALGLVGAFVDRGDFVAVVPPPPGLRECVLSRRQGLGSSVDLRLAESALTRADLDARFGAGMLLPRVHPDRPFVVAYHVAIAGAPWSCTLFASFAGEPTAAAVASEILLRRDSAPSA